MRKIRRRLKSISGRTILNNALLIFTKEDVKIWAILCVAFLPGVCNSHQTVLAFERFSERGVNHPQRLTISSVEHSSNAHQKVICLSELLGYSKFVLQISCKHFSFCQSDKL